jgi:ribosomal protein S14
MPIRPSQRFFYPIDWPQLSAAIRFGRAHGRCERCGRPHGAVIWHLSRRMVAGRRGLWWDADRARWRCGRGRTVARHLLPSPDDMAALHLQLAFWPGFERAEWPKRSRVALSCCHLDHDPTNNAARNLAALCQHCHLDHDRADNLARRREGARRRIRAGSERLPDL